MRLPNSRERQPAGHPRLDGIDQEALLRVAVAQFLFGAGGRYLLVDLAAPIRVFEDEFSHGY